jgi:hypothetical protein
VIGRATDAPAAPHGYTNVMSNRCHSMGMQERQPEPESG